MLYIIILFFILGIFHSNIIYLINFILKHPRIISKSFSHYFYINIFSFIFKYIFYLYLIYTLYNFLFFYIHFDETFINNIILLSFDDLVNLSTNEYNINNNNTTNIYLADKVIEHVPKAIATYGAYKAGMSIAKNAPTLSGKIITAALVAGTTASAVSFGTILGENLAKDIFKNKFLFTMATLINNNHHLNIYPYSLLPDMFIMNSCCIGFFIIILNIILVEYIKNMNLLNYLPSIIKNSRLYLIIEFFFNRYITIWNKSKKPILIISLIFIIINLSLIQLGLYIIIHHNPI